MEQGEEKRKVLFVDDEQNILDGLRNLLRKKRKIWDMHFALGAEKAMELLSAQRFDVVVSDMRMPGMDGAAFLARVRDLHPATVRIILSGHTEQEAIIRAVPVAHRFLAKPCDPDTLQSTIERVLDLRNRIEDERVREILGSVQNLPSLPQVYHRLNEVLADENSSAKDVAAVVEQDMGIAAKVLQLVNSAFFGLPQKITSVERAVAHLGMATIKSLVTSAVIYDALNGRQAPGFSPEGFQAHSMRVAQAVRKLVRKDAEDAFLAGLLHDVGKLVMIRQAPELFSQVSEKCAEQGRPRYEIEYELSGCSHAEIGGGLLALWGIPGVVVDAVACHHRPPEALRGLDPTAVVYLVNELSEGREPDPELLEAWGIAGQWQELSQQAIQLLDV
ncbi:MAG: HDOD domain-containing protein [Deltaproteobacteria bacterium]|nr:MAG: HDOD domain-containing protein [Deltaproteobacteria bacterium]